MGLLTLGSGLHRDGYGCPFVLFTAVKIHKMKLFAISLTAIGLILLSSSIYLATELNPEVPLNREYSIELINQDTVKVFSHSTQKLYTVPFNSIDSVLLIDNL